MKQKDYQSVVNQKRRSTEYNFGERIAYHHQSFSESLKSHLMAIRPSSILSRQLVSRRQWSKRFAWLLGGLSRKINKAFQSEVLFRNPLDLILLKPFTRITKGFSGRVYLPVNSTAQGPGNTSLQAQEGQGYEEAYTNYSAVLPEARQRNTIPDITEHIKYSHAAEEYILTDETTNVPGASQFMSTQRDRLHQTPQQISPTRMPKNNVSAFAHSKLVDGNILGSPSSLPVSPESNGMPAVAQPTGLPPIAFSSHPVDTAQSDSHHPADSGNKEYSPSNTEMSHATDIASTSGKDTVLPEARQRNTIPDITEHIKYSHAAEEYILTDETTNVPGASQFMSVQLGRLRQTPQRVSPTWMLQSKISSSTRNDLAEDKTPGSSGSLPVHSESEDRPATDQLTGLPPIAFSSHPVDTAQSDSHHPADSGNKEYSPSNTEMSHLSNTESDSYSRKRRIPSGKQSSVDLSLTKWTDEFTDEGQKVTKRTPGETVTGRSAFGPVASDSTIKMSHILSFDSQIVAAHSRALSHLVEIKHQHKQVPFINTGFTRIDADSHRIEPINRHPVRIIDRENQHEKIGPHSNERLSTSYIRQSALTLDHWQNTPQEVRGSEAVRASITESTEGIILSDVSSRTTMPTNPEEIRTSNENSLMLPGLQHSRIESLSQKSSLPIDKRKVAAKTGSQSSMEEHPRQIVSSTGALLGTDRAIEHSVAEELVPLFGSPITDGTEETSVPSRAFPHHVNASGYTSLMADEHLARSIPHRYHTEESITLSPLEKSLHPVERLNATPSNTVSPAEPVEIGRSVNDYEESVSQRDTEALAREVYAILKRQFATERERLGAKVH